MQRRHLCLLPLVGLLLGGAAFADDLDALIDQHVGGSDEARIAVIDAGPAAIPGLVEVMRTQTGVPAERAAQALKWIAEFAAGSPDRAKVEWALVNVLMDRQQPPLARQTAAQHLWHVARADSVSALAKLVDDPDVAADVLWSLQNVRSKRATEALEEAFASSRGPQAGAILEALGRRSDASPSVLTEAAATREASIRLIALQALGRKTHVSIAAFLQERAEATEGEERDAALLALVSVGDNLGRSGDPDAARRAYGKALELGGNATPVVVGALEGLAATGNEETVAAVARFMGRSNPAVQVAAASALARLPGEAATAALAQELAGASLQKARPILSALADRADPSAVDAVIPLARVDNVDVRKMALNALGRMGDRAAGEVILEAYQDPDAAPGVRNAAFEAYLSIAAAQVSRQKVEVARGLYESAVTMAETDAQKAAALNGLATVAGPGSLAVIEPSLGAEGAVREAAVGAYMAGAEALVAAGDREAAIAAYTRALDAAPSGPRVADIARRLGMLGSSIDPGSRNGFVTHWWVIGPFPSDKDYSATDTVFFPEQGVDLKAEQKLGNQTVKWTHQHTLDAEGRMDYVPLFTPHENVACYAFAEVSVGKAAEARLHVGSDDSLVVWINGEEAYRFKGPRSLKVGQDVKDIALRPGANAILIKVVQSNGDWSSSVQLTDRDDRPLRFEQRTE